MSRLIDADALEKEGWSLHRTVRVDRHTMEYQTKPIAKVPTIELRCEECEAFNKTRLLIPQPERKKGKWIVGANHGLMVHTLTCDQCNHSEVSSSVPNFCPNCGADMRGEQDGQT